MRRTARVVIGTVAVAGAVAFGAGTAQADPAGQWSPDGLTYCDPFCDNYDKTAPPFSADPTAYVCTTGPSPFSPLCSVAMDVVRVLPPFPAGRFAQALGFAS